MANKNQESQVPRVLLMEGGRWKHYLNIETQNNEDLKAKLRYYSLLYDKVLINAGDYLQSKTLHPNAKSDPDLWGPDGSVLIVVEEKFESMGDYVEFKAASDRPAWWLGERIDSTLTIRKELGMDGMAEFVDNEIRNPLAKEFQPGITDNLRKAVIDKAIHDGFKSIADCIREWEKKGEWINILSRDTITELVVEHSPDASPESKKRFFLDLNTIYYLNGAKCLGAESTVHPTQAGHCTDFFASNLPIRLYDTIPPELKDKFEHYRAVEAIIDSMIDVFYIDRRKLIERSSTEFLDLINKKEAKYFRKKLWETLQSVTQQRKKDDTATEDSSDQCEISEVQLQKETKDLKEQFKDIYKPIMLDIKEAEKYPLRDREGKFIFVDLIANAIAAPIAIINDLHKAGRYLAHKEKKQDLIPIDKLLDRTIFRHKCAFALFTEKICAWPNKF